MIIHYFYNRFFKLCAIRPMILYQLKFCHFLCKKFRTHALEIENLTE
jgi:hypothetical protein